MGALADLEDAGPGSWRSLSAFPVEHVQLFPAGTVSYLQSQFIDPGEAIITQ